MRDYTKIEQMCIKQSELSKVFVDDFLIYYCAKKEGLEEQFTKKLRQYRSIVHLMPERWSYWAMSQYVAFRLFRQNGFAKQYIINPAIKQAQFSYNRNLPD